MITPSAMRVHVTPPIHFETISIITTTTTTTRSTTMPRNSHGHLTYNFHTTATTTTSALTITMPYKPIYSPIKHRLSYHHKQPNCMSGITKRTTNEPFTTMVSEWLFKITFSFRQQYNSIPIESTIIILVISF